ncbi:MAG: universal stress protein [Cyanomargarita calcarea GSE-NOS-MK-12-04C]|jgi:two-component system sensor histidine kinase KdpD|uniref:Universal stress protein n=1 Tax=Cyanomargarita calcarea GSE-NOS-MK-12-04C TaxID=2839659 RepID=A0A951QP79_9CYAN|nr:universal stress protein [Cyanomargarita calcarea GSE-NOS-MK-12-04C]
MYNKSAAPLNSIYVSAVRPGKHKIFIGMAPGVGKTYKMLEEAQRLKHSGIDVVIGWLETHGRQETASKAEGLEVIPRKTIQRGGLILTEMDTEAILERQPQLVLVDELAHTNIPGSERDRRYQDVEAILEARIDVYSTVNIQHLESHRNTIARITGIVEQESIPDNLLKSAKEVVVVDVTPETLDSRLQDGKIYPPDKIESQVQNLFLHRNLLELRELALREVADKIEQEGIQEANLLGCNGHAEISLPCCIHERILVCVSCEPNSLQLIQRGSALADCMNAPLYVLYVHNPDRLLTKVEALYLETCKRLSQEFKAELLQVSGNNIAEEITKVATSYRITQVVLGQTHRSMWQILLGGSLINQLVRSLAQIDLHLISIGK